MPTISLATVEDMDGVLSGEFRSDLNVAQMLSATSGDIAGSSIAFPPGSLAFSTSISMQTGTSLASTSVASSLGVSSLTQASSAVVVSAGSSIDASSPFTIQLALSVTNLHFLLSDPYERLHVVYKVTQADAGQRMVMGIIPRSELIVSGNKVSFQTKHFGQFQAVYTEAAVADHKQVESDIPILTKAAEKNLESIVWQNVLVSLGGSRSVQMSTQVGGLGMLRQCHAIFDRNRLMPWDRDVTTQATTHSFVAPDAMDGTYYGAFECVDDMGRIAMSPWSQAVTIKSLANSTFVLSSISAGSGVLASVLKPIVLAFSNRVKTTNVPADAIKVWRHNRKADVTMNVQWQASGERAILTPTGSDDMPLFSLASRYRVELKDLKSVSGESLVGVAREFVTEDGGWGKTAGQIVSDLSPNDALPYQLKVANNGNAIGAGIDGGKLKAFARIGTAGTWTSLTTNEFPCNISGTDAVWSDVAMDPFGRYAVVAAFRGGSTNKLYTCLFKLETAGWQVQTLPDRPYDVYASNQAVPVMATTEQGSVLLVWYDHASDPRKIKSSTINLNAESPAWSAADVAEIGVGPSVEASTLSVALSSTQRGIIAWRDKSDPSIISAAVTTSITSDSWLPVTISDPETNMLFSQTVAASQDASLLTKIDALGNAYVIWKYDEENIQIRRFGPGDATPKSAAIVLGTGVTFPTPLDAHMDGMGNLHLAWFAHTSVKALRLLAPAAANTTNFAALVNDSIGTVMSDITNITESGTMVRIVTSIDGGKRTVVAKFPSDLRAAYVNGNGEWQPSADLNHNMNALRIPAFDAEGNVSIVYSIDGKVYALRSAQPTHDWVSTLVYDSEEVPDLICKDPAVAVDRHGRITAAWPVGNSSFAIKTKMFQAQVP